MSPRRRTPTLAGKRALLAGAAMAILCGSAASGQTTASSAAPAQSPGQAAAAKASPRGPAVRDGLQQGELYMEADQVVREDKIGRTTAEGNIEVRYNGRTLRADRMVYEESSGTIRASGNITVVNADGTAEFADEILLDDEMRAGVAQGFAARLPENVKVAAASAVRRNEDVQELNRAIYTPCDTCTKDGEYKRPTWSISADRVVQDKKRQTITYRNARFHVLGVPVLYLPVFWHADPQAGRSSGFLPPKASASDRRGASYEQPYYWAISPYSDLTISPQFNSKVNPFLNLRGRKRFYSGEVDLRLGYTRDRDFDGKGNEFGDNTSRSYILGRGAFRINEDWRWGFTAERASDDLIFDKYEIGSVYESRGPYVADDRRLISQVYAIRQDKASYFSTAAISLQGLRSSGIVDPETGFAAGENDRVFPVIGPLVEGRYDVGRLAGGRLRLNTSAVVLSREQSPVNMVTERLPGLDSARLSGEVDWRRDFTSTGGLRVSPFVNVRADAYRISDILSPDLSSTRTDELTRTLATVGADITYPVFRRFGDKTVVLEPVVQVLASPDAKQVVIGTDADGKAVYLNEDSVAFEFDETTLFRPNKFPGYDLYEDGVRLNVAGRAMVLWDDGRRANLLVGRSFRTEENRVFPERSGLRDKASDWIVAADAQPVRGVSVFARARLDSENLDIHRLEAGANVYNRFGNGFVRYLTDDFDINGNKRENLDLGGEVYLTKGYGVSFYGSRDLQQGAWVVRDVGVFYRDDCIRVDVIYRREDIIIGRLLPSETVSVRLTLATLGGTNGR